MALTNSSRVQSIDFLRGLVMLIMALDHCRDFFHYGVSIDQNPLDFATTTPMLFLTRWVTHFCAPVFVFLSGTSIFLYSSKGKSKKQVAFFLLSRGVFLMLVEILFIGPMWDFNIGMIFLQVIWVIGLCMAVLSVLQFLPYPFILALGLIIVFGHNLLDPIVIDTPLWKSVLWSVIHQVHEYPIYEHGMFVVKYPFLPWLGIMMLGYSAGKLYQVNPEFRRKILRVSGIAAIVLFFVLRFINKYGDMHVWQEQKSFLFTCFDFINATKYPPSLIFILMTLGPALILLSFIENVSGAISSKIIVFGRVPLFYYLLHIPLIHSIAWLTFFARGYSWSDLDFTREASLPYASGNPLWYVYLMWIVVILILYFPCRWYSRYKASHKHWWLSYL